MSVVLDESVIESQVSDARAIVSLRDLKVYYGASLAVSNVTFEVPKKRDHGAHRSFRVRQEHRPALHQPHERSHSGRARRGPDSLPRAGHL